MSSKKKGKRTEKKAIQYLKELGFIVDQCELSGKFRKSKDLFSNYCINCWKREEECCDEYEPFPGFDLVAIHPSFSPVTIYAQIKTNHPPTQRPYKEFAGKFAGSGIEVWCMTWFDRDGWRIQNYLNDGHIAETDLRKSKNK